MRKLFLLLFCFILLISTSSSDGFIFVRKSGGYLFSSNWNGAADADDNGKWDSQNLDSECTVSSDQVLFTSDPGNDTAYLDKDLPSEYALVCASVDWKTDNLTRCTATTQYITIVRLADSGGQSIQRLLARCNAGNDLDQYMQYYRTDAGEVGDNWTPTDSIEADSIHTIKMCYYHDSSPSSGYAKVWIQGNLESNQTSIDNDASNIIDSVRIGVTGASAAASGTFVVTMDNFYLDDGVY